MQNVAVLIVLYIVEHVHTSVGCRVHHYDPLAASFVSRALRRLGRHPSNSHAYLNGWGCALLVPPIMLSVGGVSD